MSDVLAYLNTKNLALKQSGSSEVHTACFFCGEDEHKAGRLYFSVAGDDTDGLYMCHLCGAKGNLITLKKHFGDATSDAADDDSYLRQRIMATAAAFYHDNLDPATRDWLTNVRGLTPETIERHQLGWANGQRILFGHLRDAGFKSSEILATGLVVKRDESVLDFFQGQVTIPYHVAGQVVMVRGKEIGGKYLTPPGAKARIFNTDVTWGAEELALTEGEFDALVLEQLGIAAVGVPGAGNFQKGWDGYFTDAQRVYICFDPDEAGLKGAQRVKGFLGIKARTVQLPVPEGMAPGDADVSNLLVNGYVTPEGFRALLRDAMVRDSLLVTVAQARQQHREMENEEGLPFGYEELDGRIKPGLIRASVAVILAKTNCLSGDTQVVVNRAGKSFRMRLDRFVDRFKKNRWDPKISTRIQHAAKDDTIRLVEVANAWCSGERFTYTLVTESGRSIRASAQHPFLTPRGFLELSELGVGDEVCVNGGRSGAAGSKKWPGYRSRSGLYHHPHAVRRKKYPASTGWSVQLHRLVAEADLNGLELEEFISRCRNGDASDLKFIDPGLLEVHHLDGDRLNNELSNLVIVSHAEHGQLHAANARNVLERVVAERIVSIKPHGPELTYDVEVADDPHNFIANGFVVHNSGKTIGLLNIFQLIAMQRPEVKILFVSLEQSRGDWFERARRIWNFYNLGCPQSEVDDRTEQYWDSRLRLVDKNRVSEDQLRQCIDEYALQVGTKPDLVAVDYLGYWAAGFKGKDRYERVSDAIMTLKEVAKDDRLVIIAPHQLNRTNDFGTEPDMDGGRDSGAIEETADMVLTLWSPDTMKGVDPEARTGNVNLRVGKTRSGGKGTILKLRFAPLSLVMVPMSDARLSRMAGEEIRYQNTGDAWQQAIWRHKTGQRSLEAPSVNELLRTTESN